MGKQKTIASKRVIGALPKQRSLRRRTTKCVWSGVALAADPMLIKAEAPAINVKKLLLRRPVLSLAAHPLAKDAGVQSTAARVADTIQDTVGFGGKFFAQALFEIRSDTAGQTQHVDEGFRRATVFRALQESGNVGRQTGNRRRDADADLDAGVRQGFHRFESRVGRRRERFDRARNIVIGKRNGKKDADACVLG